MQVYRQEFMMMREKGTLGAREGRRMKKKMRKWNCRRRNRSLNKQISDSLNIWQIVFGSGRREEKWEKKERKRTKDRSAINRCQSLVLVKPLIENECVRLEADLGLRVCFFLLVSRWETVLRLCLNVRASSTFQTISHISLVLQQRQHPRTTEFLFRDF